MKDNEINEQLEEQDTSTKRSIVPFILFVLFVLALIIGGWFFLKSKISSMTTNDSNNTNKTTSTRTIDDFVAPPVLPKIPKTPEQPPIDNKDKEIKKPQEIVKSSEDQSLLKTQKLQSRFSKTSRSKSSLDAKALLSNDVKLLENPDYLLLEGTYIPCVLETTIVSERDGNVSCVVTENIYSSTSKLLLIEKGSKAIGVYQNDLALGDTRIAVIWTRLITPNNVNITINSPSTSGLGASGVTGKVDNRWGTRIGSALLVSMISDVFTALAEIDNDNDTNIHIDNTSDSAEDMASTILEKYIDLEPIVYKQQGDLINIYVAKDVDFSKIYSVIKAN